MSNFNCLKIRSGLTLLFLLTLFSINVNAQSNRVVNSSFNTWWSNVNKYNLHKKWYLSSELHVRRTEGLAQWQQFLFRPAVNFAIHPSVHFAVGYTFILTYPYGKQSNHITTPEHNVWEQITLKHKLGKVALSHRYRFEQRFIRTRKQDDDGAYYLNGFTFAERFRYRIIAVIPLVESNKWFVKIFDEIWITQNDFAPTDLNQNWAYVGFGYRFNKRGNLQLGFMDQLVRKGDGIHYENNPTLQFTIGYVLGKFFDK